MINLKILPAHVQLMFSTEKCFFGLAHFPVMLPLRKKPYRQPVGAVNVLPDSKKQPF